MQMIATTPFTSLGNRTQFSGMPVSRQVPLLGAPQPQQPPRAMGRRNWLGQEQDTGVPQRVSDEQLDAIAGLKTSWEDLESFRDWLEDDSQFTVNTYAAVQPIVRRKVVQEIVWLDTWVIGKTGSPQMETDIKDAWTELKGKVDAPVPSVYVRAWGHVVGFFKYLGEELVKVWDYFVDKVKTVARVPMRKYWDMAVHILELREDFVKHAGDQSPADYSLELREQDSKLLTAEAWIATIQATFRGLSGADIDVYAQDEFGQYPEAQLGVAPWVGLALTAAAVTGIILVAYGIVMAILKLGEESPWAIVAIVGVIAGAVALPLILSSSSSPKTA